MSIQDAAAVAVARWEGRTIAGMDMPTVMVSVAGAETGGTWQNDAAGDSFVNSTNKCRGYASWGLWQFNMAAHYDYLQKVTGSSSPCDWASWLSQPANCARAAESLFGDAQEYSLSALRPWTVWWSPDGDPTHDAGNGNGIWRRYWGQAQAAVAEASTVSDPPPPAGQDVVVTPVKLGPSMGMWVIIGLGLAAMATGLLVLQSNSSSPSGGHAE